MKILRFIFVLLLTVSITVVLNQKIGDIPPLGKFMDPFQGFWQNSSGTNIPFERNINHPQLTEEVKVYYDEHLIPHIFAENERDLYFVQGYVVAQNRLWQMEFQTMAAAGRVAEILGPLALDYDRLQRRKGMVYGARQALKLIQRDTATLNLIQAYADGVNAYLEEISLSDYPLEYKLLDYSPEPWTIIKTCLLFKFMADMLSGSDGDLENTNLLKLLGLETFNRLYPEDYQNLDPVIPRYVQWNFDTIPVGKGDPDYFLEFNKVSAPQSNPLNGSNNWAVSGNKTVTGNPILANDMHLALNLPSIWYIMQLQTPEQNVIGGNLPGALGIISGSNDSISWGLTNARRDVRDWYKIKFRDKDRMEYQYDNHWLKTQTVIEKIKVRGEKTFIDTVIYTHYGPVVYDRNFNSQQSLVNYALRWTIHEPSNEQKAVHVLNRAVNYEEFNKALEYFVSPSQNIAFASVNGDIAIHVSGQFPAKWKGQGKFLMNGANPRHEWEAYIPKWQNPAVLNPPEGYVSSANQRPVGPEYPYYVYDFRYEDFRNRRINDRLKAMQSIRAEDMMRLQFDNFSYKAFSSLPVLMEQLDSIWSGPAESSRYQDTYNLLRQWDFFYDTDKKTPVVFDLWWNNLYKSLWHEIGQDSLALRLPEEYQTIQLLKEGFFFKLLGNDTNSESESLKKLVRESFIAAADSAFLWEEQHNMGLSWGAFKGTDVVHLLRIEPFSIMNVSTGGNYSIINANARRHGVSVRFIFEMGNPVKGWLTLPGGQSGNPGSFYYDNMIESWKKGDYIPLLFLKNPEEGRQNIKLIQSFRP
jgi:penicillin amidase